MEKWRLLDIESSDPCMNLAIEEAIVKTVGAGLVNPTVRFWRNPNAVVIGRFQSIENEVDLEECKKYKTSIVRRFTGGGAVYQDFGNLNCAVALPKGHRLLGEDISATYKILGSSMINALIFLGVKPYFNSSSIYVYGKKVSGMAGTISDGAVFHHGTLLIDTNIEILRKVLKNAGSISLKKYVESRREEVTTLSAILNRSVLIAEVKKMVVKGFEQCWGIELVDGNLTNEEKCLAQQIYEEKYLNNKFNAVLF
ncbi:MAG: lipoate--protein ligase family protein [Candidatus Hadarchaeum sp.]|uniref:lipoate--protein ligase family protein n=1 Tax=Candidatus Hadarchaeum sp. TaxID=2883567 RepID=UPI003175DBCE